MIIVDATVLADFFVGEGALKDSAEFLAREDPDWISVSLWRYEFGNVLCKVMRGSPSSLPAAEGMHTIWEDVETILAETVEYLNLSEIWRIARTSGLTFYDASYVWLAHERDLPLRTRDREILRKFPDVAVPMPGEKEG